MVAQRNKNKSDDNTSKGGKVSINKLLEGFLLAVIIALFVNGGIFVFFKWVQKPGNNESDIIELKNAFDSQVVAHEKAINRLEIVEKILEKLSEAQIQDEEKWDDTEAKWEKYQEFKENQISFNNFIEGKLSINNEQRKSNFRGVTHEYPVNPKTNAPYTREEWIQYQIKD